MVSNKLTVKNWRTQNILRRASGIKSGCPFQSIKFNHMYSYDEQIKELTEDPSSIVPHWNQAKGLFKFVGEEVNENGVGEKVTRKDAGCLTMIKGGSHFAYINGKIDYELTEKIRLDPRVPMSSMEITVDSLPVFKEYQEYADSLVNQQTI